MHLEERRKQIYDNFTELLENFISEVFTIYMKKGLIDEKEDVSEEKVRLIVSSVFIPLLVKGILMAGNLSMTKADIVSLFIRIINSLYKNLDIELVRNKINVQPRKNQEHLAEVISLEEFKKKREKE